MASMHLGLAEAAQPAMVPHWVRGEEHDEQHEEAARVMRQFLELVSRC